MDENGEPILDRNGRPVQIHEDQINSLGAKLSDPIPIDIDESFKEKLNVLANMIKGMTEEEAKVQ